MIKISDAAKYVVVFAAASILAGCGGSQSTLTPSAEMNAVRGLGLHESAGVTPDLGRHETIGYVSNFGSGTVLEFKYPKGEALGTFSGGGSGFCSRTSKGTFWVTVAGAVEEFKVGGSTPIKTLHLTTSGGLGGCSIDKSSGDLAVMIPSGVVIFKHASGSGKKIEVAGLSEDFFIGYDGSGNLFVDGFTQSGTTGLVELPAGGSSFHPVTLSNTIAFPGGVQWDGTYITVADQAGLAIYGYTVSGHIATLKRTVNLSGASDCVGGYIYKGHTYLCPDAGNNNATLYAYPAGGAPIDTWTGSFSEPLAAIVVEK